jgi:hypothetical protein
VGECDGIRIVGETGPKCRRRVGLERNTFSKRSSCPGARDIGIARGAGECGSQPAGAPRPIAPILDARPRDRAAS